MAVLSPTPTIVADARQLFSAQRFMSLIGAELVDVADGYCEVQLPWRHELGQHAGFFHGGAIASLIDVSGGFAAMSLLPHRWSAVTVEYKLNIVAPGDGERLIGRGTVLKQGRRLITTEIRVTVEKNGVVTLCAVGLQTMAAKRPGDGVREPIDVGPLGDSE